MSKLLLIFLLSILSSFCFENSNFPLCGTYKNRGGNNLFSVSTTFRLNNDSTFSYISRSCLGTVSSFGKWRYSPGKVHLVSTPRLLQLIKKQKIGDDISYVDFNNTEIRQINGGIELLNTDNNYEILYKVFAE
jgi:hypothetical protein